MTREVVIVSGARSAIGTYRGSLKDIAPTGLAGQIVRGALITVKAFYELERIGGRFALVTMCIGGGQGIAAIFERTA